MRRNGRISKPSPTCARSVFHLAEFLAVLGRAKVSLRIETIGVDTSTATGKLMLSMVGAVAQFERKMTLERQ